VNIDKGISFLKGSLFDLESTNSTEQTQFTGNAEEFLRKNSEANVLSRFGAMFFEYLYTMDIESNEDSSYYESTPAVKEESYQRMIVGPSMLEITSGVVHRMEMVMKLSEDDANARKGNKILSNSTILYSLGGGGGISSKENNAVSLRRFFLWVPFKAPVISS
jgi:hypothetical protein